MKNKIQKTTGGTFIILMGVTMSEKVMSFLYQTILAAKLGASTVTDSYFTASGFTTMIDATIFGALIAVLLAEYTNTAVAKGEQEARGLLSNMLSLFLACAAVMSLLLFCFAEQIGFILAPGFSGEQRMILIRCLRFFSLVPIGGTYVAVHQIVLRHQKRFVAVSIKSLFISVFGIAAVLLFAEPDSSNADAISIGYLASMVSYSFFMFCATKRYGILKVCSPQITEQTKRVLRLMLPMIIGNGVTRVALMVDKIVASMFQEGMVSCLSYAQTLKNFVGAFFVTNICTILLTDFVNYAASGEIDIMKRKMRSTISVLMLLLVPVTLLTVIYHREIVSIVFERGSFTSQDTEITAKLLMWYALGFIPTLIQNIYLHVHYAFGDTGTTMRNGIIAVICNFVVSVGLAFLIGVNGIAIGTVISAVVSAALAGRTMQKHLSDFRLFEDYKFLLRTALAAVVCAAAALGIRNSLHLAPLWSFACATTIGGALFFIVLLIMGEPMLKELVLIAKNKLKRNY